MRAGSCAGALARVTADSDARLTRLNDTRRLLYTGLKGRESEGEQIRSSSVSWGERSRRRGNPQNERQSSPFDFFFFFFFVHLFLSWCREEREVFYKMALLLLDSFLSAYLYSRAVVRGSSLEH